MWSPSATGMWEWDLSRSQSYLLAWCIAIRLIILYFFILFVGRSSISWMIIVLKHENMFSLFIIIMPSSSSFSHSLLRCSWWLKSLRVTIIIIYRKISAIKDHFFGSAHRSLPMDDEWAMKWKLFLFIFNRPTTIIIPFIFVGVLFLWISFWLN